MSRSYRKTNITGFTTADSEKKDKRMLNRMYRRIIKEQLSEDDDLILPKIDEVYEIYKFDKDGKMLFDPEKHPKLMRK